MLFSCDPYDQDSYEEQMMVETFLTGGEPLPEIKLSRTLPFDEPYTFERAALRDLQVEIQLYEEGVVSPEDADGAGFTRIPYVESDSAGIYVPQDDGLATQPGRFYRLEVRGQNQTAEEAPVLTSSTFVPPAFELLEVSADTIAYQSEEQLTQRFSQSNYPGRQNYFVATTLALEPDIYPLTPFYSDVEDEDNPGEFIRVSSGVINEDNYDRNEDGSITIDLPWIAVAYFGPQEVSFYSIDDNLYDYLRTVDIQTGGSTLSPGQIENVLWNVEGGIGLFASRSGITTEVFVTLPEDFDFPELE
ncbi:MAG: DUF4249 family protein [Cyclonatronaceae bacterium]